MNKQTELNPQEMSAKDLIDNYGIYNNLKNLNTKIAKSLGDEVKTRVSNGTMKSDEEAEKFKISLTNIDKSYFDEAKLIEILNSLTYAHEEGGIPNICVATGLKIVKMKPYVDMDALEDAIYNGKIRVEDIAPAKINKVEQRLTVKEIK